ncbi:MAG: hypothetical protein JWQ49_1492 [Edaphobacter sp.]|nr:hypothetical protein [Edaphobacter sp.]
MDLYPSLPGAGLFPYWLGSFAYPRRSKNEWNAVIGAICHDERFWVLLGSSTTLTLELFQYCPLIARNRGPEKHYPKPICKYWPTFRS